MRPSAAASGLDNCNSAKVCFAYFGSFPGRDSVSEEIMAYPLTEGPTSTKSNCNVLVISANQRNAGVNDPAYSSRFYLFVCPTISPRIVR
jgi:hypothetical protein